jgi:hypothetical protein
MGIEMDPVVGFFFDNAGYVQQPGESPFRARMRAAKALTAAEARLKAGPFFVSVEPDDGPYDGDVPYDGPMWVATLWTVDDSDRPEALGSLCGIACESDADPYLRVVAAELADEHIPA